MLYQTTRSTPITVGSKSVLTLYCVPKVLYCFYLISVQGKWLVLSCPLFGGFTGLEGNIGCQILGGFCPTQSEYWGGGAPKPPSSYAPAQFKECQLGSMQLVKGHQLNKLASLPKMSIPKQSGCKKKPIILLVRR